MTRTHILNLDHLNLFGISDLNKGDRYQVTGRQERTESKVESLKSKGKALGDWQDKKTGFPPSTLSTSLFQVDVSPAIQTTEHTEYTEVKR